MILFHSKYTTFLYCCFFYLKESIKIIYLNIIVIEGHIICFARYDGCHGTFSVSIFI